MLKVVCMMFVKCLQGFEGHLKGVVGVSKGTGKCLDGDTKVFRMCLV